MAYVTPSTVAPASSWSMTDMESRTDPPPARTTSGNTPSATGICSLPHTSPRYSRSVPGGTSRKG
jgi:hypothetical protein